MHPRDWISISSTSEFRLLRPQPSRKKFRNQKFRGHSILKSHEMETSLRDALYPGAYAAASPYYYGSYGAYASPYYGSHYSSYYPSSYYGSYGAYASPYYSAYASPYHYGGYAGYSRLGYYY